MSDKSALILALLADGPRPLPYMVAVSGCARKVLLPTLAILESQGRIRNVKRGCRAKWELNT